MLSIVDETRAFIETALDFDHDVATLTVSGTTPETLEATITKARKPPYDLPIGSGQSYPIPLAVAGTRKMPSPPFDREVLVELVIRMQRRRWQRFDDFVLGLSPPNEEDWRQVYAVLGVHPEHGSGWFDLVLAAAHWIIELGGDPRTGQLKEKYGSMRWYYHGDVTALGDEIISAAEHLSERICEVCGAPGESNHSGWVKVRCEEHADE